MCIPDQHFTDIVGIYHTQQLIKKAITGSVNNGIINSRSSLSCINFTLKVGACFPPENKSNHTFYFFKQLANNSWILALLFGAGFVVAMSHFLFPLQRTAVLICSLICSLVNYKHAQSDLFHCVTYTWVIGAHFLQIKFTA